MKRTLLLINLLLLSVCVFPQENIEVNYATIKKYVENQSDDYQQLIERFEANDSLLSLNVYAVNLASELQREEEVQAYIDKYIKLSSAIISSGDGTSEDTAFKVISVNDEYQILNNVFKVEGLKQQSLVNKCDLMEFESSPYYEGTQIYFDISRSLDYMKDLFK